MKITLRALSSFYLCSALLCSALALLANPVQASFVKQTIDPDPGVRDARLAFDPSDNQPSIVYVSTNGGVKYAKYDGKNWNISAISSDIPEVQDLSLAFDPTDGRPAVCYSGKYVKFNGTSWASTVVFTGKPSSLAFDPTDNKPSIAALQNGSQLIYIKFNGSVWTSTSIFSFNSFFSSSIKLLFDPNDKRPVIINGMTPNLTYIKFSGLSWSVTSLDLGGAMERIDSAFDSSDNRLALLYTDYLGGGLILAKFNGSSWDKNVIAQTNKADYTDGFCPGVSLDYGNNGQSIILYGRTKNAEVRNFKFQNATWIEQSIDFYPSGNCRGGTNFFVSTKVNPTTKKATAVYFKNGLGYATEADVLPQNPATYLKIGKNIFHPSLGERAVIFYKVPQSGHVTIKAYNLSGNEIETIVDQDQAAGDYTAFWKGNLTPGLYLIGFEAPGVKESKQAAIIP